MWEEAFGDQESHVAFDLRETVETRMGTVVAGLHQMGNCIV